MTSEEGPNSAKRREEEKQQDRLTEEFLEGDIRSSRQNFTNTDDRPEFLRMEFAGPDSPIDTATAIAQHAIRYFDLTLAKKSNLFEEWDSLESGKQRMIRAAVLRKLFDDGFEDLEKRLKSSSLLAREMGFDPENLPSDTTLWRGIRSLDDDVIEEAARRTDNTLWHDQVPGGRPLKNVGTNPEKPQFYYEITKYSREISTERKMRKITEIVSEYMSLAVPSISFDRDLEVALSLA